MRGQSLLEIAIALGALSVLMTVAAVSVITSLSNANESRYHNQASIYAQQGMDVLRQMRDSSWADFDALSGTYCMPASCTKLTSSGSCGPKSGSCGANVDIYSREVTLYKNDAICSVAPNNVTRAVVTVGWPDKKCSGDLYCRKVQVETCFSNIYYNSGI